MRRRRAPPRRSCAATADGVRAAGLTKSKLHRYIATTPVTAVASYGDYPFTPYAEAESRQLVAVAQNGHLLLARIREVDPTGSWPPEVRTADGETLFVPASQQKTLEAFALECEIPLVQRVDVWSLLLRPYLDTWFPADERAATHLRLLQVGIDKDAAQRIRELIGPAVQAYNAVHWEWCHLGLFDLLNSLLGKWETKRSQRWFRRYTELSPSGYATLYTWAMEIAELGRSNGATSLSTKRLESIASALAGR